MSFSLFQSLFGPRIILVSVLVAHLAAGLSSSRQIVNTASGNPAISNLPELFTFLETRVETNIYKPFIEFRLINILYSILIGIVFYKVYLVRQFIKAVITHYQVSVLLMNS